MTSENIEDLLSWAVRRAKKRRLSDADAQDCAQEALLRYVEHKSVLEQEGGVRRWLEVVVDNIVRDNYRVSKRAAAPVRKRSRKRQQKAPAKREPNYIEKPGTPLFSPIPKGLPQITIESAPTRDRLRRILDHAHAQVDAEKRDTYPLPNRSLPYRDRIEERVEKWLALGFAMPRRLREFYVIWKEHKGDREKIVKFAKKDFHSTRRDTARLCKWFDNLEAICGRLEKFLRVQSPEAGYRLNALIVIDCMRHFRPAALRKLTICVDEERVKDALQVCRGRYSRRKGFAEECVFEQILKRYPEVLQVTAVGENGEPWNRYSSQ